MRNGITHVPKVGTCSASCTAPMLTQCSDCATVYERIDRTAERILDTDVLRLGLLIIVVTLTALLLATSGLAQPGGSSMVRTVVLLLVALIGFPRYSHDLEGRPHWSSRPSCTLTTSPAVLLG